MKDIDEFAAWTEKAWFSSEQEKIEERDLTIMGYGLAGETGEVMEILKKRVRDNTLDLDHLKKELGDQIFYWARICRAFDLNPSDVLAANIAKNEDRKARGVQRGSGNNR